MATFDTRRNKWRLTAETRDPDGRRRRIVRDVDAPNTKAGRRVAEAAETGLRAEVRSTGSPRDLDTFAGQAALWVARHRADWSPTTTRHTEAELANHIEPYIGGKAISAIDPTAIEVMYAAWTDAGAAASVRRRRHGIVHAVFADAERLDRVGRNPMRRVRPAGGKAPERDVPTAAEVRAIIDGASAGRGRAFLTLAAGTGARRGSLVALTWRHLDLDRGSVWFKVTKVGRPYTVTLAPSTVAELAALRAEAVETALAMGTRARFDDLYVFSNDGGTTPWYPGSASRVFALAAEAADLGGRFTLHALRHFHATACLADGLPAKWVAGRLGCTEANVVSTYSHRVADTSLDDQAAAIAEAALTGA